VYSNILIGGLRINALARVPYGIDVMHGMGTSMMWSIAQISTGIIVACCPHLRPLFERLLPNRLTRISLRKTPPPPARRFWIVVTTRIEIRPGTFPLLPIAARGHCGHEERWAPRFEVESRVTARRDHDTVSDVDDTAYCPRYLPKCSC
jgi:hypothetical protein